MPTNKPQILGGPPNKPLSRHENMFGRSNSTVSSFSPKSGSRLSMGGQRLNSPRRDGEEAVSIVPDTRRALPTPPGGSPASAKKLTSEETKALLKKRVPAVASRSNTGEPKETHKSARPLGVATQTTSRPPLPRGRSPTTTKRISRSMTVSDETPKTPVPLSKPQTPTRIKKNSNLIPPRTNKPPIVSPKPTIPAKPKKNNNATKPPSLPPKPVVLSEEEHNQINEACKKFCNANKQLLVVSRITLAKVQKTLDPVQVQFLNGQLGTSAEELKPFNDKFSEFIREAGRAFDQKKTCNIACLTVDIANFSSVICAGLKHAAVECGNDESVFKQSLKSITTIKDSLIYVVDTLKAVPDKVDPSLVPQLEQHIKKISTTLAGLVGHKTTGPLIPVGNRMEIEAAIRAAVVSIAKLVNSFNGPLEQSILTEAKVASCCVAQTWATLNETVNTNTNLLSTPEIRQTIIGFAADLKQAFAVFMEATKDQVSNPCPNAFTVMKEHELPLRNLFHKIVSSIQAFSVIDTSQRTEIDPTNITPTDAQIKVADNIIKDPEDIVPPPPANITQSSFDIPDDYVPSTPQIWDEPESDEGRALFADKNGTPVLRCGTLNKLIIHTTGNLDTKMSQTFITTYRSFTTPEILLEKTIQRYHVPPDVDTPALPIQLRCCNLLKNMIETQSEDFSPAFLNELNKFLTELESSANYKKMPDIIRTSLMKKQEERQNTKTEILNLTIEEKIPLSPGKLLFVIAEEEIARQLTLVDFRIYRAIKPAELLNQAWSKAKYKYRAKNVLALVARSTALTMWVASVILWQETLRGRVRAYTKIVNIAQHMYRLNNFNSLMAILAGLNTSAIYRLKFTRDQIPDSAKQIVEELSDLMEPTQSYSNYRQKLHDVDPPCVPFLGTYLTDITFIEDGNPDYVQGLINYRKRELVCGVIREIQQYQQQAYTEQFVNIAHFLTELPSNDEEKLYDLSLLREPRGATLDQLL